MTIPGIQETALELAIRNAELAQNGAAAPQPGDANIGRRPPPVLGQICTIAYDQVIIERRLEPRRPDHFATALLDSRLIYALTFQFMSSLDTPLTVQLLGAFSSEPSEGGEFFIGGPSGIAEAGQASIGVDIKDSWHPYFGLIVTPQNAPIRGEITVIAHVQRFTPLNGGPFRA